MQKTFFDSSGKQGVDEKPPAPPTVKSLSKGDVDKYQFSMMFFGGFIRLFKGIGVGLGVASLAEPLLIHYLTVVNAFTYVTFAGLFGLILLGVHIKNSLEKIDELRKENAALNNYAPGEMYAKWIHRVDMLQLQNIDPVELHTNHKLHPTNVLYSGCQQKHIELTSRLLAVEKKIPSMNSLSRYTPDSVSTILDMRHQYQAAKQSYEHSAALNLHDMSLYMNTGANAKTQWLYDYSARGQDITNLVMGVLFGYSLYKLLGTKVLTAASLAVFPGGAPVFMGLCILLGSAVFQLNERWSEAGFKKASKGIANYRQALLARRYMVKLKIKQAWLTQKLDYIERELADIKPNVPQSDSNPLDPVVNPKAENGEQVQHQTVLPERLSTISSVTTNLGSDDNSNNEVLSGLSTDLPTFVPSRNL